MALPLTRNTTYSNPSQVKSVDLNDVQDQIISIYAGKHGTRRRTFKASAGQQVVGTGGTWDAAGAWNSGATGDVFHVPLVVDQGERITAFYARVDPAATGVITVELRKYNWATHTINPMVPTGASSGDALQMISVTGIVDPLAVVAADADYYLEVTFTLAAGHRLFGFAIDVDAP